VKFHIRRLSSAVLAGEPISAQHLKPKGIADRARTLPLSGVFLRLFCRSAGQPCLAKFWGLQWHPAFSTAPGAWEDRCIEPALIVQPDDDRAEYGRQGNPIVAQVEKLRSRCHLAQPIGRAGFDLPEALNRCCSDDRSARPLHPDLVTNFNLAPGHRMPGLMRLSEDADLRAIARAAYVFLSPDNDMIHLRICG